MYLLYGGPFTRALINEMVMVEGGIDYELHIIDIVRDEHRTPEFLAINPAGWVPALITPEGETLYETPAISLYLAERHELTHLAPAAGEPERGRFLSGLFSLTGDLEPAMKRYFYPHRFVVREEDATSMKELALKTALDRLSVVEGRLGVDGPYHLGQRFSLVDITLAYWVANIESSNLPDALSAVRRCTELVMARPKLAPMFDQLAALRDKYGKLQAKGEGVV